MTESQDEAAKELTQQLVETESEYEINLIEKKLAVLAKFQGR